VRPDNYIAFFTVCGFFVGLMFVVVKVEEPVEFVIYTLLITFFFYIVIHIVVMNYIDTKRIGLKIFNKEHHEEINDYLLTELAVREHRLETLIRHLDQKLKRSGKKHESNKEKAA
jgi:uncharacterized membrane-anchored protein YitT (DUF2179 family)